MANIFLIFAHPALEKSRTNTRLIRDIHRLEGITFHDLYEAYPDFHIDIKREQQLLAAHDFIILHHPMYWYSSPALVKQWEDLVLEHGWAYGSKGTALRGKKFLHVITTGGGKTAYEKAGMHGHTIREFLLPFEQTAKLCGMAYLPPYLVQGTHRLSNEEIERYAAEYFSLLQMLRDEKFSVEHLMSFDFLNEIFVVQTSSL